MTLISPALMRGYTPRQSLGYINAKLPPYNAKGDGTTDDSTAINSAIAAAGAANGPGEVRLGAGIFIMTVPLALTLSSVRLIGAGKRITRIRNITTNVVTLGIAGGATLTDIVVEDLTLENTGVAGGNVVNAVGGSAKCAWNRVLFYQANTAKRIWEQIGAGLDGTYVSNRVIGCEVQGVLGHSVALWYHSSSTGAVNANLWEGITATNAAAWAFHIICTAAADWNRDNIFRNMVFEVTNGGCIRVEGGYNTKVDIAGVYDLSVPTTQHLFYFGRNGAGTQMCRDTFLTGIKRHGGTLGAGMFDIAFQGAGAEEGGIYIEGCRAVSGSQFAIDLNAGAILSLTSDVTITNPGRFVYGAYGQGFVQNELANGRMGRAVLVGGTLVVSTIAVTAASEIFLTCQVPGGTPGFLRVSARVAATSFTILSSNVADTSTVAWFIVEPV